MHASVLAYIVLRLETWILQAQVIATQEQMAAYVRDVRYHISPVTREFREFNVRY